MGQLLLFFLCNFCRFFYLCQRCLSNQPFFTVIDNMLWLCSSYNTQGEFAIIFLICKDLLSCLRSVSTMVITTVSTKTSSKSSPLRKSAPKAAILHYFALYDRPRNLKFKQKNQQYNPCFQSVSPFLLTMVSRISNFQTQ